jgi:phosphate:Na+ symporter
LPIANLMMRLIGVAVCLPFMGYIREAMVELTDASHWSIVYFHTAFNVALAVIFLPFVPFVAKMVRRFIPDRPKLEDESTPLYLNNRELALPLIALTNASRETLRLADLTLVMMGRCRKAFEDNDVKALADVKEMDDKIDKLFSEVKSYMAKMEGNALNENEAARHFEILTFATNLEHIGDVIDRNLLPMVDKKIKQNKMFSQEGFGEIRELFDMVIHSIQLAQTVFISEDVALARQLVEEKGNIKEAEIKTSKAHMSRLREGRPETMDTSSMHMDMIRDLRRINSLITSVAYPILEEKGQLSRTRLKPAAVEDMEERP